MDDSLNEGGGGIQRVGFLGGGKGGERGGEGGGGGKLKPHSKPNPPPRKTASPKLGNITKSSICGGSEPLGKRIIRPDSASRSY